MPYYDLQGGGAPVNNSSSIVITKDNNPLTMPAGFYSDFEITANVSDIKAKRIIYTHHQCSTSKTNQTYTDDTFETKGATSVSNLKTVNNQTVSTTKGGCYTTPYYYYSVHHAGARCTARCHAIEEGHESGRTYSDGRPIWAAASVCDAGHHFTDYGECKQYAGQVFGQCPHRDPDYDTYHYSTTKTGNVRATYYLKSCGYNNGQPISAEITY